MRDREQELSKNIRQLNIRRTGDWIETYTGINFYPLDPRIEEINAMDIIHALSLICRFNGHCKHFYSVGQHSINVYNYLRNKYPNNPTMQLAGLLHDASEAYIADVSRPVKPFLTGYSEIEKNIMEIVFEAYGLPEIKYVHNEIKEADDLVLHAEAIRLMPGNWCIPNDVKIDIEEKPTIQVRQQFVAIFNKLVLQRKELLRGG